MPERSIDQRYLLSDQYQTDSNLSARAQLHIRFSTNRYGWTRWVFEQLDLPAQARILELGCGPGWLWAENRERIPAGWSVTLSDFSTGMVEAARDNLADAGAQFTFEKFTFEKIDAQAIPFPAETFDAVIANHMLYHVPDRARALTEIRRVLRPEGALYAATNGRNHMRELNELMIECFSLSIDRPAMRSGFSIDFTLESGYDDLIRHFQRVYIRRYHDALIVTEVEPLVAYIVSGTHADDRQPELLAALQQVVEQEMGGPAGAIRITKDTGLFVAYPT